MRRYRTRWTAARGCRSSRPTIVEITEHAALARLLDLAEDAP